MTAATSGNTTLTSRRRRHGPAASGGVLALAVAAALALPACQRALAPGENDALPVTEARQGGFVARLRTVGELQAERSRQVSSSFSGKLTRLVPEGTLVKEGDPVAWMETSDLEDELKDLTAEVQLSEADCVQQTADVELLKGKQELALKAEEAKMKYEELVYQDSILEYENQKVLVEKNLAARSTLDEKKLAMLQAELSLTNARVSYERVKNNQASDLKVKMGDLEKAQIQLDKVKARMEEIKGRIDGAVIRAVSPGYINYCMAWRGARRGKIAEGDAIYRHYPIVEVPDPSSLQAIVAINEADIVRVRVGQKATVRVDALPDVEFTGSVVKKSLVPLADDQKSVIREEGVKEFSVAIGIDKLSDELRQGMTAKVEIIVDEVQDQLLVPVEAVFDVENRKVAYVQKGGVFEQRTVKTGASNNDFIVVREGLKAGERVALREPKQE